MEKTHKVIDTRLMKEGVTGTGIVYEGSHDECIHYKNKNYSVTLSHCIFIRNIEDKKEENNKNTDEKQVSVYMTDQEDDVLKDETFSVNVDPDSIYDGMSKQDILSKVDEFFILLKEGKKIGDEIEKFPSQFNTNELKAFMVTVGNDKRISDYVDQVSIKTRVNEETDELSFVKQ